MKEGRTQAFPSRSGIAVVSITSMLEQRRLPQDLEGFERANILRALEESGWKVKGEGNAASRLGINPSTLRSRMKKLGIVRS
jgi:transcriptional regulator with GAF, ATPase, and Fis domain